MRISKQLNIPWEDFFKRNKYIKKIFLKFFRKTLRSNLEVVIGKNIRQQTCCLYVLSDSSPFPCKVPKSNLHQIRKISAGKHNGCANSEIGYTLFFFIRTSKFCLRLAVLNFFSFFRLKCS